MEKAIAAIIKYLMIACFSPLKFYQKKKDQCLLPKKWSMVELSKKKEANPEILSL